MTTTIDLLSRVVYVERLVVERLGCFYLGFLPLSRARLRERFKDEEGKQHKSFNIKVPDPWSSGEPPGSFMLNDLLFFVLCRASSCLTWLLSAFIMMMHQDDDDDSYIGVSICLTCCQFSCHMGALGNLRKHGKTAIKT